jgi:hypothetical protein
VAFADTTLDMLSKEEMRMLKPKGEGVLLMFLTEFWLELDRLKVIKKVDEDGEINSDNRGEEVTPNLFEQKSRYMVGLTDDYISMKIKDADSLMRCKMIYKAVGRIIFYCIQRSIAIPSNVLQPFHMNHLLRGVSPMDEDRYSITDVVEHFLCMQTYISRDMPGIIEDVRSLPNAQQVLFRLKKNPLLQLLIPSIKEESASASQQRDTGNNVAITTKQQSLQQKLDLSLSEMLDAGKIVEAIYSKMKDLAFFSDEKVFMDQHLFREEVHKLYISEYNIVLNSMLEGVTLDGK